MKWGSYGELIFKSAFSPDSLSEKQSYRFSKHDLLNGYPSHEFQGEDENLINVELTVNRRMNLDPDAAHDAFKKIGKSGNAYQLVIGSRVMGNFATKHVDCKLTATTTEGKVNEKVLSVSFVEVRN